MKALMLFALAVPVAAQSHSVYTQRPDDPAAVTVSAVAAGQDATAAIQAAIDTVQAQTISGQGIVFLPEGRYTITKTLYVGPGVRVIGYGMHRPVLVLPPKTPGFQHEVGYMVFFTGGRPSRSQRRRGPAPTEAFAGTVPPTADVYDANPGTFYSAMSNVDFEIGEGNPSAVGIRFHAAQHCFLTHMDFEIGSGMAALKDVGNEGEDLHFHGGRFGIVTSKPSPGWQYTLLDSTFEGQREAAIDEHEAGLTLVRDSFRNVPAAVTIDPGYAEELWVQESRFENISGPAIVISNEKNERTQISVKDAVFSKVPILARYRESGKEVKAPSETYQVKLFTHGLEVQPNDEALIRDEFESTALTSLPEPPKPRIRPLPDSAEWTNVRSLGAKGDGKTDDTAALEAAIRDHKNLYLPEGRYLISRPLTLRPDTVLIGLHPSTTRIDAAEATPAFDGAGAPVALLTVPAGGHNIVSGIGIYPSAINSRAAGVMWMAGEDSLMDDVRFLGGHGTTAADGTRLNPYNASHSGDPDPKHKWDAQYPSLWVLNGGGGVFANIWTPDTFAQAGLYVSDTKTPGHVYELSSEHHVRNAAKLTHVSNWEIVALQTEEEWGESPVCLPLEIDEASNILVANMHSYRVVGSKQTFPYAVRVSHSKDVTFRNLHIDSDSKVAFNDAVFNAGGGWSTRYRELGTLAISGDVQSAAPSTSITRVATGFYNISGAAVDGHGVLYFVDPAKQLIYRYAEGHGVEIVRDSPLEATNLAVDKAGNVMVVSYGGSGTVYSFKPDDPENELTVLAPQPAKARPGMSAYVANDRWALRASLEDPKLLQRAYQYVSPDGTTFIPAGTDFVQGELYYGTKMSDVLRSFALAKAEPGKPFYLTDEEEHKTYAAMVQADGTLANLKLFAERGGESVAVGPDGKVYVAAGEVYVYSPGGELLRTIETPERPIDLIFGGADGKTLYVLARTSLYEVKQ